MKRLSLYLLVATINLLLLGSCSNYDVTQSKPGEPIGPISNLSHSESDNDVKLTWELPSSYPNDIIQPVSIYIAIEINGHGAGTQTIDNAPTNYIYTGYDSSKQYTFTVKVKGKVDTSDPNVAHVRYSLGNTVEVLSSQ